MNPRTFNQTLLFASLLTISSLTGCACHRCANDCNSCCPCNEIEISNVRCDQCENCPGAHCGCGSCHHAKTDDFQHHTPMCEIMPEMRPATTPDVVPDSSEEEVPGESLPETASPKPMPETNPILPPPTETQPSARGKDNYYLSQEEQEKENIFTRMGQNLSRLMGREKEKQHAYYYQQNKRKYSPNPYVKKDSEMKDYPESVSDDPITIETDEVTGPVASNEEINMESWSPLSDFTNATNVSVTTGEKKVLRERDIEAWPFPVIHQDEPVMHTHKSTGGIQKISQEVYPNRPIVIIPATVE